MEQWQSDLIAAINRNDKELPKLLANIEAGKSLNFFDENGMTPLQHACYKGNTEAVRLMLDMGADVEYNKHGSNYTALHFGALSGNTQVCRLLLDAGIDSKALNSINRTAAQMAAFVGNHACVETINSYINRDVLEYYTVPHGQQTEALIPPSLLEGFHEFVITVNLHPVRIALNLQQYNLIKHLPNLKRALQLMCEKEMKKSEGVNELLALKFHYLCYIVSELIRCQEKRKEPTNTAENKNADFVELFIKRVLKENKLGQMDYLEYVIREAVREFPFWECTIFRQIAQQFSAKDPLPALTVLRNAINGHRGFAHEINFCSTCGNEKPDKKCSKCKKVQYCDRECQRLHWFMHKKSCERPTSTSITTTNDNAKANIDAEEIRTELAKLTT